MRKRAVVAVRLALSASSAPVAQQAPRPKITTPKEALGVNVGDDYVSLVREMSAVERIGASYDATSWPDL